MLFRIFLFLFLPLFGLNAKGENLNIYSWSEYFSQEILEEFEKETGIKVHLDTYTNNQEMYANVRLIYEHNYDLIMPSTYFILPLREKGLIQKIDKTKIPNFKNISQNFLGQFYDVYNQYSIPFLFRIMGLAYNEKILNGIHIHSWRDLWRDEFKGKVAIIKDYQKMLQVSLVSLGYSRNTKEEEKITKAFEELLILAKNANFIDFSKINNEDLISFFDGNNAIATMWINDVKVIQKYNKNIHFIIPKEGGMIWMDSFALTANAKNIENAYRFINFTLRPDISVKIANNIKFNTTLKYDLIKQNLNLDNYQNIVFMSDDELNHFEFEVDIGQNLLIYIKYWDELKRIFN